jgi:Ca-activated chloride channel homolog
MKNFQLCVLGAYLLMAGFVVFTGCSSHNNEPLYFMSPLMAPYSNQNDYLIKPSGQTRNDTSLNTEEYNALTENVFTQTSKQALTTFSIDVDRASYTTTRQALMDKRMPARKSLRLEEFINYFDYNYATPKGNAPIAVETELATSPWNEGLQLLRIGLQAKRINTEALPPSNLVFLLDVSGSMNGALEVVKESLYLVIDQMREQDRVSIVVYAGNSGLVLPATSGANKQEIKAALDRLQAGGSTAGGEGIKLAYSEAMKNFRKEGNNRIILCTDGDFNVGVSSDAELQSLIEEKRKTGIFLSCLGFGQGNYKDNHMETLADKGNGNYAYIDNLAEAKKVLVKEFGGTIFTVAKDVKLQIEFNPTHVKAYRLIGYENRKLNNEDFNDDKKDAGEMGSGHTVTALYEIIPQNVNSTYLKNIDASKYQTTTTTAAAASGEVATLKIRYKEPTSETSQKLEHVINSPVLPYANASENFRFAMAVAEFGLLLRQSEYKGNAAYAQAKQLAKGALGSDTEGYRKGLLELIDIAVGLDK